MESTEVGGDLVASLQDLIDRSDRLLASATASDGVQEGREWCAELALQGEGLHVGKKFPSFQALVDSSKVLAKKENVKHHVRWKPSFGQVKDGKRSPFYETHRYGHITCRGPVQTGSAECTWCLPFKYTHSFSKSRANRSEASSESIDEAMNDQGHIICDSDGKRYACDARSTLWYTVIYYSILQCVLILTRSLDILFLRWL